MQIADLQTKVPTPDPLPLRSPASWSTIAFVYGAGRGRGVEALVTDQELAAPSARPRQLVRSRGFAAVRRPIRFPPKPGWGANFLGADDEDLAARFRTLAPWLQRCLAARFGRQGHDVEALVQESFIRLARYSVFERSRHPKALLMRIAGNLARDGHRSEARRAFGRHQPLDEEAERAYCHQSDPELLYDIKAAIVRLPEPLRDVFVLARFTPLTHEQIGERLGISAKTVEWRLAKALAMCAEWLGLPRGRT